MSQANFSISGTLLGMHKPSKSIQARKDSGVVSKMLLVSAGLSWCRGKIERFACSTAVFYCAWAPAVFSSVSLPSLSLRDQ